jgi:hypothetical protein
MPRVVFGLPMYRSETALGSALESLLAQEYEDFAIVAVDDASPDGTLETAEAYARTDSRVVVEANPSRLGMIGNYNRTLARAHELHPDAEYFAWASDNDLREPGWLSLLVTALDSRPQAVLAYTGFGYLDENRQPVVSEIIKGFRGTKYVLDPAQRFRDVVAGVTASALIQGLQRVTAREHAGPVPRVLLSDVLLLSHLALYGEFVKVPGVHWYRGPGGTGGSRRRQRAALFSGRPPVSTLAPIVLQHAGWLFRATVIGERRPPGLGRTAALRLCLVYVWENALHPAHRRWRTASRSAERRRRSLGKRWRSSVTAMNRRRRGRRRERRKRRASTRRRFEQRLGRTALARYFVRLDRKTEEDKMRDAISEASGDERLAEALSELYASLRAAEGQAKVVAKLIRWDGDSDLPDKLRRRAATLASKFEATFAEDDDRAVGRR